ncbi:MAG: hypothetical protein AAGF24_06225 [Cyanobacteria bacterium P01_H01_bin.121]
MDVTAAELKFLLRLLGCPGYRSLISKIKVNAKTLAAQRDRIGRDLCSKGLVDYSQDILRFVITPSGKTLLNLDTRSLPITPDERHVLMACLGGSTKPTAISTKVPASDRPTLIQKLADRGLLKITEQKIKAVWLTAQGQHYLRYDCRPTTPTNIVNGISLTNYLNFLRSPAVTEPALEPSAASAIPQPAPERAILAAAHVLQTIRELDTALQTNNYVPIFQVRAKLQPPLSRTELDQWLYTLERENQIEMSTLQEVSDYPEAQIAAGIAQDIGGPLFFISVLD